MTYIDLYLIHAPWGHSPASADVEHQFGTENMYFEDRPVLNDFDHVLFWKALEQ